MKKSTIETIVALFAITLSTLFLLSSCQNGSSNKFVGTWKHRIEWVEGQASNDFLVLEFHSDGIGKDYMLYSDGEIPSVRTFTYTLTNSNTCVDNDAVIYYIDGNTLYKDHEAYTKQ